MLTRSLINALLVLLGILLPALLRIRRKNLSLVTKC